MKLMKNCSLGVKRQSLTQKSKVTSPQDIV